MSDKKFELSRRNALIGLGTVGVASAGAGIGTSAFFSDQEEFDGNTIQAGDFALTVVPTVETIDQDGGPDEDFDIDPVFEDVEEGDEELVGYTPIQITDAKPGDTYEFCWEVTVQHNPGLAKVTVDGVSEDYGVDADELWDVDNNNDRQTLGESTEAKAVLKYDGTEDDGETDAVESSEELSEELELFDGMLEDLFAALGEDGLIVPADAEEFCHDIDTPAKLCIILHIPAGGDGPGNTIQGAETSFNLNVHAEQCRHNDVDSFANVTATEPSEISGD